MTQLPAPPFAAAYAEDDVTIARRLFAKARPGPHAEARIDARARDFIGAIRDQTGLVGGLEDFLREYASRPRRGWR